MTAINTTSAPAQKQNNQTNHPISPVNQRTDHIQPMTSAQRENFRKYVEGYRRAVP